MYITGDLGYRVNKSQYILADSVANIVKELAERNLRFDKLTVAKQELSPLAKLYLEWES